MVDTVTMKKQHFIQLHQFFSWLESEMDGDKLDIEPPTADSNQAQAEYEQKNVKPTSIHKSKTDHKESVQLLAEAVCQEIQELEQVAEPTQVEA